MLILGAHIWIGPEYNLIYIVQYGPLVQIAAIWLLFFLEPFIISLLTTLY